MSPANSLDRIDVAAARRLCGQGEIVVVTPADEVVDRYRLLRYSGQVRGKGTETFAVKDATNKFFVRSDKELGLTENSPYTAFLAAEFDSSEIVIDLNEAVNVLTFPESPRRLGAGGSLLPAFLCCR